MKIHNVFIASHLLALSGLFVWGALNVGGAGTLTAAFWLAWLIYSMMVIRIYQNGSLAKWFGLIPPTLWAVASGSDLIPQLIECFFKDEPDAHVCAYIGDRIKDALLITIPCTLVIITFIFNQAAIIYRRT